MTVGERYVDSKKAFVVHPDIYRAFKDYRSGDQDSFKKVMENRDKILVNGEIFWDSNQDETFKQTAEERSSFCGFKWPKRKNE